MCRPRMTWHDFTQLHDDVFVEISVAGVGLAVLAVSSSAAAARRRCHLVQYSTYIEWRRPRICICTNPPQERTFACRRWRAIDYRIELMRVSVYSMLRPSDKQKRNEGWRYHSRALSALVPPVPPPYSLCVLDRVDHLVENE